MGSTHQPANDFHKGLRKQNAGQSGKHCSWLFLCCRSEESGTEERSNSFGNKNSKASISPTDGTGHQEYRATKLAGSEQSVPPVSDAKSEEVETKGSAERVEEDGVDKDAEKFINKMRRKISLEALKSMKRYESMLHRGY